MADRMSKPKSDPLSATNVTIIDDSLPVQASDSPSVDAFGRWRVSEVETIFDSKQVFDNLPLIYDDQEVSGSGTSSTHNPNRAATEMAVSANTAGKRVRQSFMRMNYQPGKATCLYEKVITPQGIKTMGEVRVGDEVFDGGGNVTKIIGTATWEDRNVYRLTFDDGTTVDADEAHEWVTIVRYGKNKGERVILTTKEMLEKHGEVPKFSSYRFRVPGAPVLQMEGKEVPIDPYTLGVILGDGHIYKNGSVAITNPLSSIQQAIPYETNDHKKVDGDCPAYGVIGISKEIKNLGLAGTVSDTKCIPEIYLLNEESTRLAVLQGLMDTDGTVGKRDGTCEFNTASKQLAEDVAFLVRSLGGQAKIRQREAGYKNKFGTYIQCKDSYRVRIIMPNNPFKVTEKASFWKARNRISLDRYIHSIIPLGTQTTKCIEVESEEHTYLTTGHIVTHNSQLILCTGTLGAGGTGITAAMGYFDDNNGLFAMSKDGEAYFVKRSYYTGSVVDTEVAQADWNLDTFDGNGPSGITLDPTKSQILFIDFEWLGVGRVRMGWVVDGLIYYCHEFLHSNNQAGVYMSTPNLPIRYELANDGTGGAATMQHICASVMSEGGVQNNGYLRHYDSGLVSTLSANTAYAIMGGRLKSTHLGATVLVENISVIGSANDQAHWELRIGGTVAGTFTYADVANSAVQVATGANTNTVTGGIEIDGGYFSTTQGVQFTVPNALHLGAAIDNTPQEWQLVIIPITNNMSVRASVTWRELL